MSRNERNSVRRGEPSTSSNHGRSGYRRSPEPGYRKGRQVRQPERDDNRRPQESDDNRRPQESDDNRRPQEGDEDGDVNQRMRHRSPENTERKGDQIKDKSKHTRGRWKDAGEDQLRVERRQARLERMKKAMRLFEDSLLIDKVDPKERKPLMEDVRERLEVMKKEHAQKMKEQVTSHWSKLTEEGRGSRAREDTEEEEEDDSPPRSKPRHAKSGGMYNREKSRYMSGEVTHRNRRGQPEDDRHTRNDDRDLDDDSPKHSHPRVADSGDVHNRSKNRVMSGENDYRSKGDNRGDRAGRRDEFEDNDRTDSPKHTRSNPKVNPRGQSSGDVHNRQRNRLRSGDR